MPSIDELLSEHARRWREHVDAHARLDANSMTRTPSAPTLHAATGRRRRWLAIVVPMLCAGAAVAAILVVIHSHNEDPHTLAAPGTVTSASNQSNPTSGHATRTASDGPDAPGPSPTAQAWGSCGNIRNETDARSLVASGEATALVEARLVGTAVTSYTVLAGHVTELRTLNLAAAPGRYIVLLGGTQHDYYVAFGYYGMYRVAGPHAYQLCAYNGPQVKRGGVTDAKQIIELLRDALRVR